MGHGKNDILQGTLTLLVLRTLAVRGRCHGYGLCGAIQSASQDLLRVEEGSLYPALHRMAQEGLLKASWGLSEKGRRARFYEITPSRHRAARGRGAELAAAHARRRARAAHELRSPRRNARMGWLDRTLNVFRSQRLDAELDDELAFHIAERTDELIEEGALSGRGRLRGATSLRRLHPPT